MPREKMGQYFGPIGHVVGLQIYPRNMAHISSQYFNIVCQVHYCDIFHIYCIYKYMYESLVIYCEGHVFLYFLVRYVLVSEYMCIYACLFYFFEYWQNSKHSYHSKKSQSFLVSHKTKRATVKLATLQKGVPHTGSAWINMFLKLKYFTMWYWCMFFFI